MSWKHVANTYNEIKTSFCCLLTSRKNWVEILRGLREKLFRHVVIKDALIAESRLEKTNTFK